MEVAQECPLCGEIGTSIYAEQSTGRTYFGCGLCDLRYLSKSQRLDARAEKAQYDLHENDVSDPRYQAFVMPIYKEICRQFDANAKGLDFGAGPGPVLAEMFRRDGFKVDLYDPIYWQDKAPLSSQYDFVVVCEVAEHLYNPLEEFRLLFALLRPGGVMCLMTLMIDETTDFSNWHYRRDPTHVVFYSERTFHWIKREVGFSGLQIHGPRLVSFKR